MFREDFQRQTAIVLPLSFPPTCQPSLLFALLFPVRLFPCFLPASHLIPAPVSVCD